MMIVDEQSEVKHFPTVSLSGSNMSVNPRIRLRGLATDLMASSFDIHPLFFFLFAGYEILGFG